MMSLDELINDRQSIRSYSDKKISREDLNKIVEAGRFAPSAHNKQCWKFIVVDDEDVLGKLVECMPQEFTRNCKAIIAVCGKRESEMMNCGQPRTAVDTSIATTFMHLKATELGIGTCWMGNFDSDFACKLLEVPEEMTISTLTVLGYADEKPKKRPRKTFDEVVSYNKF